jgi:hypothetical protein
MTILRNRDLMFSGTGTSRKEGWDSKTLWQLREESKRSMVLLIFAVPGSRTQDDDSPAHPLIVSQQYWLALVQVPGTVYVRTAQLAKIDSSAPIAMCHLSIMIMILHIISLFPPVQAYHSLLLPEQSFTSRGANHLWGGSRGDVDGGWTLLAILDLELNRLIFG